jgi:hypothetical protein
MNLICFPHYTCGGLLCDIFNETFSEVGENGGIKSIHHGLGKIGDSNNIFETYDPQVLYNTINKYDVTDEQWIATHCHPAILDYSKFNSILIITTTTFKSKIYRWIRSYYHYYCKSAAWHGLSGLEQIDKERETAKNYLKPFLPIIADNVTNIEFSEIVENSIEFKHLIGNLEFNRHLDRWKQLNSFLYDTDIWTSIPVKRFYEAELEINLGKEYRYA